MTKVRKKPKTDTVAALSVILLGSMVLTLLTLLIISY